MIIDTLKPVKFFRELGIPVRSAMNTDVNGLPWGVVDALLDHGITGISMAINEHFGHALRPWPRAFRWQAPGGRTITAYNGFIYGVTSDRNMRVPVSMEEARERVPQWTKLWEGRGYPHPFLMMQITNIRYHDNGSPQAALPDFVRRWNDTNPEVRLRFGTLSEFFDRMRKEPEELLPVMRGDWTDWWNFGSGSTAHETAQTLQGQRDLDDAIGLDAWHRDDESASRGARRGSAALACAILRAHLGRRPLDQPALSRRRRGPSSFSSSAMPPPVQASPACFAATASSVWRSPPAARSRGCSSTIRIRFRFGSRCACLICRRLAARLIRSAASAWRIWCRPGRSRTASSARTLSCPISPTIAPIGPSRSKCRRSRS